MITLLTRGEVQELLPLCAKRHLAIAAVRSSITGLWSHEAPLDRRQGLVVLVALAVSRCSLLFAVGALRDAAVVAASLRVVNDRCVH